MKTISLALFIIILSACSSNKQIISKSDNYQFDYNYKYKCLEVPMGGQSFQEHDPALEVKRISMVQESNSYRVNCNNGTSRIDLTSEVVFYFDNFGENTGFEVKYMGIKVCNVEKCTDSESKYSHSFIPVKFGEIKSVKLSDDLSINFEISKF